jgi:molecular chaperone GrpE
MTDEKRTIPIRESPVAAGRPIPPLGDPSSGSADGAPVSDEDAVLVDGEAPLADETTVEALTGERDALWDQLLRLRAEFENYRRRTQKELSDAESRARGRVLGEFLPVLDNLDRALNAAEHHDEGKVLQGVRMTHTLFEDLMRREGVTAVDPTGEAFDPAVHEAMVFAPSDQPEGVVVTTLERGYLMGDRLLRPARVAVSSGAVRAGADSDIEA